MVANPTAAVAGLTTGIADGLGVESSAVEITNTVPDLLGGARRLAGRRLQDATLTVDFDVTVADPADVALVDAFTSGDSSVVEDVTAGVTSSLAEQNIQVTIVSVTATAVDPVGYGDYGDYGYDYGDYSYFCDSYYSSYGGYGDYGYSYGGYGDVGYDYGDYGDVGYSYGDYGDFGY